MPQIFWILCERCSTGLFYPKRKLLISLTVWQTAQLKHICVCWVVCCVLQWQIISCTFMTHGVFPLHAVIRQKATLANGLYSLIFLRRGMLSHGGCYSAYSATWRLVLLTLKGQHAHPLPLQNKCVFLLAFVCKAVWDHLFQGVTSIIHEPLLPRGSAHYIRSLYSTWPRVCFYVIASVCVFVRRMPTFMNV